MEYSKVRDDMNNYTKWNNIIKTKETNIERKKG